MKKIILLSILAAAASSVAVAAYNYPTSGSGNYALDSDWSDGHVPTVSEAVAINNSAVVTLDEIGGDYKNASMRIATLNTPATGNNGAGTLIIKNGTITSTTDVFVGFGASTGLGTLIVGGSDTNDASLASNTLNIGTSLGNGILNIGNNGKITTGAINMAYRSTTAGGTAELNMEGNARLVGSSTMIMGWSGGQAQVDLKDNASIELTGRLSAGNTAGLVNKITLSDKAQIKALDLAFRATAEVKFIIEDADFAANITTTGGTTNFATGAKFIIDLSNYAFDGNAIDFTLMTLAGTVSTAPVFEYDFGAGLSAADLGIKVTDVASIWDADTQKAIISITAIPEPSTYAAILGALDRKSTRLNSSH